MIILIIGESGSGKTRACKNLGPSAVIMQGIRKRLPFSEKTSTVFFVESLEKLAASINRALASNDKNIFVIDDFQNLILKKLIFGSKKDKFQCYIDVAEDVQTLLDAAENSDKRFYFLMHEELGENQKLAALTAGKLLKEKFKFEGFFTVVLRSAKEEAGYLFYCDDAVSVAKAPEGIFEKKFMENDLAAVDEAICNFYGLKKGGEKQDVEKKPQLLIK